jgi:hypothetical protein
MIVGTEISSVPANRNQQSAGQNSPGSNPPAFADRTDLSIRAEVHAPNTDYNLQTANFRTRALLRESFKIEPSNPHGLHAATEAL